MDYGVKYGQNLLDIALQELGSIEGVLTLAVDNNLSITADLEISQIIKIDTTKIIDKKVVEYYRTNNIIIATDIPRPNRSQTITFAPIGVLEVGDVVTLNAVASSGLVVLYFSSNPSVAVVENNTLTVVGPGSVTITASQVGDSIFYPASTSQTITVEAAGLDETNLVFDFDFTATAKQTLRDSIYLTNYIDRGVSMVQTIASTQPIIDSNGLKFDGVDDFIRLDVLDAKEIWIVCNSLDGATFNNFDALIGKDISYDFYIYASPETTNLSGIYDSEKINNIVTKNFAPLSEFKSFSVNPNVPLSGYKIAEAFVYNWNGYIKRILIFDEILSEERRTALQEYLAFTYNL